MNKNITINEKELETVNGGIPFKPDFSGCKKVVMTQKLESENDEETKKAVRTVGPL